MAKYFQITTPEGVSNLKLDSQGSATLQVKAKNVTGTPCDGHASAVSVPATNPPAGAVQSGWVKIETPDQHFNKDEEKVFVVKIAVPKKGTVKPGSYQFKVDVGSVAIPDQGDSTSVFAFTVEAPPKPNGGGHFPMWLIPVILVVLIGVGIGLYFALRPSGIDVPDLTAKTLTEATTMLGNAKLDPNPVVDPPQNSPDNSGKNTPENSGKIVDQNPKGGVKAKEGSQVHVTIGAQMVRVPRLIGLDFQAAQKKLSDFNLATGDTKTAPSPGFQDGIVWDQNPGENQIVPSTTSVNLQMTPKKYPVPILTGQNLANAIRTLQSNNLDVGSFTGNTNATIVSYSPTDPQLVGTKVNLVFPNTGPCALRVCRFDTNVTKLMVLERSRPNFSPMTIKHP